MSTSRGSVASVEDRNDSTTPGSGRKSQTSPRASPRGSTASPRASVRSPKEGGSSPREGAPGTLPKQGGEKDDKQVEQEDTPKRVPIIERGAVSSFFAVAVMVNTITIGIDTQIQASGASAGADTVMLLVEIIFFAIFFLELVFRIMADRCPGFLYNSWNLLDAFLVSSSGIDIIFKVVFQGGNSSTDDMGKLRAVRLLKITRIVRLLRVLRLFRFKKMLRMLRGLVMLMFAIIGALKSLGWVALMFTITTYIFAIVTTEFLGVPNTQLADQGLKDDLIDEWFGDMPKSMFTLLQLATLEDWAHIARHSGKAAGGFWSYFFLVYVMATNSILMNVVLATLIENLFTLSSDMKEAQQGNGEDVESWMVTPSELASDEDDDGEEDDENAQKNQGNNFAAGPNTQQSAVDRLAVQTLTEFFDLAAQYVGQEGVNQRKLVTNKSLKDALTRPDVQSKVYQAVPAMKGVDPEEMAKKIWGACPRHLDTAGLSRQELAEACMVLRGELSMNHFVLISQALQSMDTHISHELVHLNKHQRKMNRRFLKLRHRLRKVYHFDGAPKKMIEMMNVMKRKQQAAEARAMQSGGMPSSPNMAATATDTQNPGQLANDGSSIIDMSNESSKSGDEDW